MTEAHDAHPTVPAEPSPTNSPSRISRRIIIYCIIGLVIGVVIYNIAPGTTQARRMRAARSWLHHAARVIQTSHERRPGALDISLTVYTGPCAKDLPHDTHGCVSVIADVREPTDWTDDMAGELTSVIQDVERLDPPTCIRIHIRCSDLHPTGWVAISWADGDPMTVDDWLDHLEITSFD